MIFYLNRIFSKNTLVVISMALLSVLNVACKEAETNQNDSESELIKRINAVQEQVMVQGNISKEEEQAILSLCSILTQNDGLANYDSSQKLILKDADMAPIFPGCDDQIAEETKSCFDNAIESFFRQKFNLSLSKALNLTDSKQVDAFFIVDESGNVTGLKVRDAEVNIQAEILRVLRSLPPMKPAVKNGNNISVLCSLNITYGNGIGVDVIYIPERPDDLDF